LRIRQRPGLGVWLLILAFDYWGEKGKGGKGEKGKGGNGERGKWGKGEMGKGGNGEMGKRGKGEKGKRGNGEKGEVLRTMVNSRQGSIKRND
jgi:hypothetical protein